MYTSIYVDNYGYIYSEEYGGNEFKQELVATNHIQEMPDGEIKVTTEYVKQEKKKLVRYINPRYVVIKTV